MTQDTYSALSDDYGRLQIIDVTHPSFRVAIADEDLAAKAQEFVNGNQQRDRVSPELQEVLRRSVLGGALAAASGSYLSGMSTYLMKLGPENLWANALDIDRRIAASFPALTSRLRLQDLSEMVADGLAQSIDANPCRPICLMNIAGGTAADSWNALICLRVKAQLRLDGRSVRIAVLDRDERGPAFGARAFHALQASGAPLHGLQIEFSPITYDWSNPQHLAMELQRLEVESATCAISSEGGLFEYGSDEEIVANLAALREGTAPDAFLVGSVTRDCEAVRTGARVVATRPRTIDAFRELVVSGGWQLLQVIERPLSYHVRLIRD